MDSMKEALTEVQEVIESLRKDYPSETNAFLLFMRKAEGGPALDRKQKELINVALSVAAQCKWCIAFHVKNAFEAGATRNEIVESGFQAVLMHGGPALMHLGLLLQAIEEFENK